MLSTDLQDDNGNQLDVYELIDTSANTVLATIAIEEQIAVVTA